MKRHLHILWKAARGRAFTKQLAFELTKEDMEALWAECEGRCSISSIPFNFEPYGESRTKPFAASLDRINAKLGYTKANCRLVCIAVNYGMGDWGEAVLKQVAAAIVSTIGIATTEYSRDMKPVALKGVTRRTTMSGFSFSARLKHKGKDYIVGTYGTPVQAHLRYMEVKKAVDLGADPLDFITAIGRQFRKSKHSDYSRDSTDTKTSP